MGDTVKSDFGIDGFGKNCIYHVIPHAIRVPKKYILSMLEISRVITIPIPLCAPFFVVQKTWFQMCEGKNFHLGRISRGL